MPAALAADISVDVNRYAGYSDAMRLPDYLAEQGESEAAFAARCGVPRSTINSICLGGGTRVETAAKIVKATGGLVGFMDLVPEEDDPGRSKAAS